MMPHLGKRFRGQSSICHIPFLLPGSLRWSFSWRVPERDRARRQPTRSMFYELDKLRFEATEICFFPIMWPILIDTEDDKQILKTSFAILRDRAGEKEQGARQRCFP